QRALQPGAPPRHRGGWHLLALRRRDVDRRLRHGVHLVASRGMQNPFRTEEQAFRFLIGTIGCAALIVIGAFINRWVGLGVFVVEAAVLGWFVFRHGRGERPIKQAPPPHPEGERRILVVANETVGGGALLEEVRRRSDGVAEKVLVVVPALNSPLKHWTSDEDDARDAAQHRLEASLATMRAA